ncbi:MAG: glycosyltransferase [Ruminococcaceae bacterium]|nr:glycosyltransferase [Oscillospiraceae bacterium]
MKKMLFVMSGMNIGGAERALLGLLSAIDYEKYSVDLFLLSRRGELMGHIDERVNILPRDKRFSIYARPLSSVIKRHNFAAAWGRIKAKSAAKRFNKKHCYRQTSGVELEYSHKYTVKYLPMINPEVEYDLAVSFITPHYIVAQKVNAKKKIAWIHTDYTRMNIDTDSELKMWDAYDRVISISDSVTKGFLTKFPTLEQKITVIEHIIPREFIYSQAESLESLVAEDMMPKRSGGVNFLSIGRFCFAKNFDNVPEMCKLVREMGVDAKWYLIGFGPEEVLIRSKIKEFDMDEYVIILGKKANPYPYLAKCDYYVQPSRFEGKAVTVCESLLLQKQTVIADYDTAPSQIRNGVDGVILSQKTKEFARELVAFVHNKELQKKICREMSITDYSGKSEVEKLYDLMED